MQHFPDSAIDVAEQLVKQFEGCVLTVYPDVGNLHTVGWGCRTTLPLGATITQEQADQMLGDQLSEKARGVDGLLQVNLGANQAAACIDLAYNIGVNAFGGSTLLRLINAGTLNGVAAQFLRWNKVEGAPVTGLTRRRQAEADLWASPDA